MDMGYKEREESLAGVQFIQSLKVSVKLRSVTL